MKVKACPLPSQPRRRLLTLAAGSAGACFLTPWRTARAQPIKTERVVSFAVPGPGNSVSAPFELAANLGLDRAAGIALRLRFVGGGGVALKDLVSGNADFASFGLPAAVMANAQGAQIVALAALDDLPLYTLMVRKDLRREIRQVADLRGRTIGIHSNSLATRTTSTQLVELVLRSQGVPPESVRLVAAGQSWDTQSAVLRSKSVDASMCDEPFGVRLESEGLASVLFSTGRPDDAQKVPGSGFLRATLMARRDRVSVDPELAGRMVDMALKTLQWIATHSAAEMADALHSGAGAERESLLAVHARYPRMFSRDGKFSAAQLSQTELFVRASNPDLPAAQTYAVNAMVMDRWAGRKP